LSTNLYGNPESKNLEDLDGMTIGIRRLIAERLLAIENELIRIRYGLFDKK
jgi:hypothetical protein